MEEFLSKAPAGAVRPAPPLLTQSGLDTFRLRLFVSLTPAVTVCVVLNPLAMLKKNILHVLILYNG